VCCPRARMDLALYIMSVALPAFHPVGVELKTDQCNAVGPPGYGGKMGDENLTDGQKRPVKGCSVSRGVS